ncbi:MAG: hypothetical protein ABIQ17_03940, partial [Candidatus Limnocylindrales bacterium]
MALAVFRASLLVRSQSTIVAALVFAAGTTLVTVLGLGSFRQVGLGSVGPAAAALVNLALLLPTAQGFLVGALTLTADRERGFGAMLQARGVGPATLTLTAWLAVTLSSWLSIAAGFGVAAVIISGNVPMEDLPVFAAIVGVALAAAAASAALGILIGALATSRLQAALVALAAWFVFAIGLDLVAIGLGAFLRLGEGAVIAAIIADPLTAARSAALLLLDAEAGVLGPA